MEYPSRSNLNCFLSFNEASAKGDDFFDPHSLSTASAEKTTISCWSGGTRTPKAVRQQIYSLPSQPIAQRSNNKLKKVGKVIYVA